MRGAARFASVVEDLEQILITSTLGDNALSPWLFHALAVETHEDWLEANRYLKMDYLMELKKEELRKAARSSAHLTNPFLYNLTHATGSFLAIYRKPLLSSDLVQPFESDIGSQAGLGSLQLV